MFLIFAYTYILALQFMPRHAHGKLGYETTSKDCGTNCE